MRRIGIDGLLLLTALGLVGCAKVPQEQVTAAQTALDEAQKAEAGTYAPDALSKAEDSMKQAQAEIAAQEEKFFKSYKTADELLAQAKADADAAVAAAQAGREQAREDASAALGVARAALTAAEEAVAAAPKTKDRKADVEAMQADIETLKGVLAEAQSAFDSGNYKGANQKAQQVSDEMPPIGYHY